MSTFFEQFPNFFTDDVSEVYCIPCGQDTCKLYRFHSSLGHGKNEDTGIVLTEQDVCNFKEAVLAKYKELHGINGNPFAGQTDYTVKISGYEINFALRPEYQVSQFNIRCVTLSETNNKSTTPA